MQQFPPQQILAQPNQPQQPQPQQPQPVPQPPLDIERDWQILLKATPAGKIIRRGKADWQELTESERSALHENFARELPLEHRQMLMDYYRSLSE